MIMLSLAQVEYLQPQEVCGPFASPVSASPPKHFAVLRGRFQGYLPAPTRPENLRFHHNIDHLQGFHTLPISWHFECKRLAFCTSPQIIQLYFLLPSSDSTKSSFATVGSALPSVARATWPINHCRRVSLPARYCWTSFGLSFKIFIIVS